MDFRKYFLVEASKHRYARLILRSNLQSKINLTKINFIHYYYTLFIIILKTKIHIFLI